MSGYSVEILPLARADIPGPELFWMGGWNEWFPLLFQAVLIRGEGITALVNTGPPDDLGALNDRFEAVLGPKAIMTRDDMAPLSTQLGACGVAPDDVTHVFLTPLQLYTVAKVPEFVNAEICISGRGWIQFHTIKNHIHDDRATSIPEDVLVHLVTDAWDRVRLLADEDEVAPGLRTWWSGVHHRASTVIEVDTSVGVVAISDSYFYLENVENDHPMGINESLQEAIDTYDRVRRTAAVILPLYDPKNLERFEGRMIR